MKYKSIQTVLNIYIGIYIGHDKEACYNENWLCKIQKLKNCMHVWKSRKLSLNGKITIIKSMAISIFIYVFSVLIVPQNIVKEINKILYNFLWNKKDRIKRNTLILKKTEGGLKMIDVASKIESLKAAWIVRLYKFKKYGNVLESILLKHGINLKILIDGGLGESKILTNLLYIPIFYAECIASFNKCKTGTKSKTLSTYDFLTQPIWCNGLFTSKNKPIFLTSWAKSGILWVKDIFNKTGHFLTELELLRKLDYKSNWMVEYMIVRKIFLNHPTSIQTNLKMGQYINMISSQPLFYTGNKKYKLEDLTSKLLYDLLIIKKGERSYMEKAWEKAFKIKITNNMWESIYLHRVHQMPNILANFIYKLIHNLVLCRNVLKKWKRTTSEFCPICREIEPVKHIYFECIKVKALWNKISTFMKIYITSKIILGYENTNLHGLFRNLLFSVILYGIFNIWLDGIEKA